MNLLYGLLVGVAMGALIQRVGASSPRLIAASLRLENLTVLKFMATTIAVGMISIYMLSQFMPVHFDIKPAYVLGLLVGGLIFGVGFAVAGYCPGTCVVGVSEGRRDARFALLGGIVGASIFALVFEVLESWLIKPLNYGKITVPEILNVSAPLLALLIGALFVTVVTVLPTVRSRKVSQEDTHPQI